MLSRGATVVPELVKITLGWAAEETSALGVVLEALQEVVCDNFVVAGYETFVIVMF